MTLNAQRRPVGWGGVTDDQQAKRIVTKPTGPAPDELDYNPASLLDQLAEVLAVTPDGTVGPIGRLVTGWDHDRFLVAHLALVEYPGVDW